MERKERGVAEPKFEKDLDKLEQLVHALEEGGLSLDDSLKKFEEGVKLAKRCEKALNAAEKRIEVLTKDAEGALTAHPFGEEESAEPKSKPEAKPEGEPAEDDGELLF